MHDVIQREIQSAGASIDAPVPDVGAIVARGRNRQRLRRAGGAIATAILVGGLTITVPDLLIDVREGVRPADSPRGAWEPVPPAPIAGRVDPVAVWTGEEFLIWGGYSTKREFVDGAAYNPETGEWGPMSAAPLESSSGRTAVWTGAELILWGGESEGSHVRPDSGAAYDPGSDSWRELPASPYWSLAGHSAVWTGSEMIVFGGVEGAASGGAIYDPVANDWETLPDAPIAGRFRHTAVWTGTEMIVWGGNDIRGDPLADGAAFDPNSHSWRVLEEAPLEPRAYALSAWTGSEVIIWGGRAVYAKHPPSKGGEEIRHTDGAAYHPDTGAWTELPPGGPGPGFPETGGGWTDGLLIVATATPAERGFASYDVDDREWTLLPAPPGRFAYGQYGAAVEVGDSSLLIWGGYRNKDDLRSDGFLLRLS